MNADQYIINGVTYRRVEEKPADSPEPKTKMQWGLNVETNAEVRERYLRALGEAAGRKHSLEITALLLSDDNQKLRAKLTDAQELINALEDALITARGQWMHSVNEPQCLSTLRLLNEHRNKK